MKPGKKQFITFLLITIFWGSNLFAQEKVKLRVNLEEGETYSLTMSTTQNISQVIMGMDNEINQTIGFTIDMNVIDRTMNGNFDINMTYARVRHSTDGMMGSFDYDSEDPNSEPTPQSMGYAALVDQSIGVIMDERGKINEVKKVEELVTNMIEFFEVPEGPEKEEMKTMLEAEFNSEKMTQQFGNFTTVYPEKEMGVGESWTQDQSVDTGFPMTLTTTYTVTDISDSTVELDVKSTVATSETAEPIENMGMEMTYDLSGEQFGTVTIDRKTGLTIRSEIKQDFSGLVDILPNVNLPEGMSFPMTITSEVFITLD